MFNTVRNKVSKKKKRYVDEKEGFDLDLSYITDYIIAMGYPSPNDSIEGLYRNPMSEVVRFLDTKHKDHYKVYNLCSERNYDASKFQGRACRYPFDDHNAPPLEMIKFFCEDVNQFLKRDKKNIAIVHCKAGKGRTGTMIASYLMHCGVKKTAKDALDFYAKARTYNGEGVTIPSQIRYVYYYEKLLQMSFNYIPRKVYISRIILHNVSHSMVNNPSLFVSVVSKNMKIYESKENEDCRVIVDKGKDIILVLNEPLVLAGDVKFELTAKALKKGKFATFWVNTTFIPEDGILALNKPEIDKIAKDTSNKEVPEKFWIEVRYHTQIDKQTLPNVNMSKSIRPVSVLGLSSPLSSSEDIVTARNNTNRRSSTSDMVRANSALEKEVSRSKTSLALLSAKPIDEVDENIKRSGSLPDLNKIPDALVENDIETDNETDDSEF